MSAPQRLPGPDLVAIRFEVDDDGVAVLTLDRPTAGNARNQTMREELLRVYEHVAGAEDIAVLQLTGAGDRFFCAGMDLKEVAAGETSEQRRARIRAGRDIDVLAGLPVPTIAVINGYALGGGLEMALACDLRLIADEAKVGLPELKHGLVPGGGGTQRLPRLIGTARTLELLYLATLVDGRRALELGIVNHSVAQQDLAAVAAEWAATIALRPARATRTAQRLVRGALHTELADGLARELDELLDLLDARAT